MGLFIPTCRSSVLIVVDLQPTFLKAIPDEAAIRHRTEFLARIGKLLDVPVWATEQNVGRMGGTDPELANCLTAPAFPKMAFSCRECAGLASALAESGRNQAVLVGIETHICVSQTAHHFLERGLSVAVCADAVGARTEDRHHLGLERMRQAGAAIVHTESIAYEWLQTAEHPRFREALALVKQFA